jgi:uncharacterized protein YihD (DUF1040 family)
MRDPARIDTVIEKLRAFWKAHPDLRLGQLVLNALRDSDGAVDDAHAFNAEDVEFVRGLEDWASLKSS